MPDFRLPRNPRELQRLWLQHALTALESELWRVQWYQMNGIFNSSCKIINLLNSDSREILPCSREELIDWDDQLIILHNETYREFEQIYQRIAVIKNVLEMRL